MSSPIAFSHSQGAMHTSTNSRHGTPRPRQMVSTPGRAQSSTPIQQIAHSGETPSRHQRYSFSSSASQSLSAHLHRTAISGAPAQMRDSIFGYQKEHNLTSFEWHVNGVRALKEEVDRPKEVWPVDGEEPETHDIFKRGAVTNEGWYKFDICRSAFRSRLTPARSLPRPGTPPSPRLDNKNDTSPAEIDPHTISLYIAALSLDTQAIDYSYTAAIFVGIKPIDTGVGSRHGETKWLWHRIVEWEFSRDAEYWGQSPSSE